MFHKERLVSDNVNAGESSPSSLPEEHREEYEALVKSGGKAFMDSLAANTANRHLHLNSPRKQQ